MGKGSRSVSFVEMLLLPYLRGSYHEAPLIITSQQKLLNVNSYAIVVSMHMYTHVQAKELQDWTSSLRTHTSHPHSNSITRAQTTPINAPSPQDPDDGTKPYFFKSATLYQVVLKYSMMKPLNVDTLKSGHLVYSGRPKAIAISIVSP